MWWNGQGGQWKANKLSQYSSRRKRSNSNIVQFDDLLRKIEVKDSLGKSILINLKVSREISPSPW
jgi:hypothetical protein